MKLLLISFALVALAVHASGSSDKLVPDKCKKEYPTPPHKEGVDATDKEKCLLKCILEAHDVLNKDGDVSVEKSKEMLSHFGREDRKEAIGKRLSGCIDKNKGVKDCELAYKLLTCLGDDVVDYILAP